MVRMLQDREVDCSFVMYSITADRAEVIDYTTSYSVEHVRLFLHNSHNAFSPKLNAFFTDFGMDFWVTLIFSMVLLAVAYALYTHFEPLHKVYLHF